MTDETGDTHPFNICVTAYVDELTAITVCAVEPPDHKFPEAAEEVSVNALPAQKDNGPEVEIVGAGGMGFTVKLTPELITVDGMAHCNAELI